MGMRSRSKRRRGASAGGADRISGLCDDVLVRILELLPDAGDAVRTGALSRRWRDLWTRASSLTFDSSIRRLTNASSDTDERFLDFVQNALAQRAKTDATLEHLEISFAIMSAADDLLAIMLAIMSPGPARLQAIIQQVQRSADAAQEWICYAMEKRVKSFVLKLRLWSTWRQEIGTTSNLSAAYRLEQATINLNDIPGSEKLETMHLDLKDVGLRLPDAAVFASLVDLSLENIDLGVGSGNLLTRLLSSACCPSLRKLQLRNLVFLLLKELLIEASALLELTIVSSGSLISGPETLKLKTPSLRILRLENCVYHGMRVGISTPKLEEIIFLPKQPDHIEVDGELPWRNCIFPQPSGRPYIIL